MLVFLIIIKLIYRQFSLLINTKYALKKLVGACWVHSHSLNDACDIARCPNIGFHGGVWIILAALFFMGDTCGQQFSGLAPMISLSLSSLISTFDPLNFESNISICCPFRSNPSFFITICSFEIIYKIIFFQSHPQSFQSVIFDSRSFDHYLFCFELFS
jgi:hypothetical protein